MIKPVFDEPLEVTPVDGEVAITGPDGMCGSFTVEAAKESAQRILDAVEAIMGRRPRGPDGGASLQA